MVVPLTKRLEYLQWSVSVYALVCCTQYNLMVDYSLAYVQVHKSPSYNCVDVDGICVKCLPTRTLSQNLQKVCYDKRRLFRIIETMEQLVRLGPICPKGTGSIYYFVDIMKENSSNDFVWTYDHSPVNSTFWGKKFMSQSGDCVVFNSQTSRLVNFACHRPLPYFCIYSVDTIPVTFEEQVPDELANSKDSHCGENCYGGDEKCENCSQGCGKGFYGLKCDIECSTDCSSGLCLQTNGSCINCTENKDLCDKQQQRHNTSCEILMHCLSGTLCGSTNGGDLAQCTDECKDGFHGVSCDKECPSYCVELKCKKDTATCSKGCIKGFTYEECNIAYITTSDTMSSTMWSLGPAALILVLLIAVVVYKRTTLADEDDDDSDAEEN